MKNVYETHELNADPNALSIEAIVPDCALARHALVLLISDDGSHE